MQKYPFSGWLSWTATSNFASALPQLPLQGGIRSLLAHVRLEALIFLGLEIHLRIWKIPSIYPSTKKNPHVYKVLHIISKCSFTTTSFPLTISFLEPWKQTEYAGSLPYSLSLSESNIEKPSIWATQSYPFPSWQWKLRAAHPIVRRHKGRTENESFSHPLH